MTTRLLARRPGRGGDRRGGPAGPPALPGPGRRRRARRRDRPRRGGVRASAVSGAGRHGAPRRSASAADITRPGVACARCATRCWRVGDRIDVLVNNAAINDKVESPATRARRSCASRTTRSSALGAGAATSTSPAPSSAARCSAPRWPGAGRGSIVNIASTYGLVGARPVALSAAPTARRASASRAAYPTTQGRGARPSRRFLAAYWGRARACASTRSRRAASENGQDAGIRRRATPRARRSAAWRSADDYEGAHRLPGQRRLGLHDRRQSRRRRRLDRVVSRRAVPDRHRDGRAARADRRGGAGARRASGWSLTDCDGVLTDARRLLLGRRRGAEALLACATAWASSACATAGIETAIVTRESSPLVARRAEKLRLAPRVPRGAATRRRALPAILRGDAASPPARSRYIGDDVNDLGILARDGAPRG